MRIEQALSILRQIKSEKYSGFEKNKALSEVIRMEAWHNLNWFDLLKIIEWMYNKGAGRCFTRRKE